jgi:hypothetical protein
VIYSGTAVTTRSIAARKLGCEVSKVVLLRVETTASGSAWIFGVAS